MEKIYPLLLTNGYINKLDSIYQSRALNVSDISMVEEENNYFSQFSGTNVGQLALYVLADFFRSMGMKFTAVLFSVETGYKNENSICDQSVRRDMQALRALKSCPTTPVITPLLESYYETVENCSDSQKSYKKQMMKSFGCVDLLKCKHKLPCRLRTDSSVIDVCTKANLEKSKTPARSSTLSSDCCSDTVTRDQVRMSKLLDKKSQRCVSGREALQCSSSCRPPRSSFRGNRTEPLRGSEKRPRVSFRTPPPSNRNNRVRQAPTPRFRSSLDLASMIECDPSKVSLVMDSDKDQKLRCALGIPESEEIKVRQLKDAIVITTRDDCSNESKSTSCGRTSYSSTTRTDTTKTASNTMTTNTANSMSGSSGLSTKNSNRSGRVTSCSTKDCSTSLPSSPTATTTTPSRRTRWGPPMSEVLQYVKSQRSNMNQSQNSCSIKKENCCKLEQDPCASRFVKPMQSQLPRRVKQEPPSICNTSTCDKPSVTDDCCLLDEEDTTDVEIFNIDCEASTQVITPTIKNAVEKALKAEFELNQNDKIGCCAVNADLNATYPISNTVEPECILNSVLTGTICTPPSNLQLIISDKKSGCPEKIDIPICQLSAQNNSCCKAKQAAQSCCAPKQAAQSCCAPKQAAQSCCAPKQAAQSCCAARQAAQSCCLAKQAAQSCCKADCDSGTVMNCKRTVMAWKNSRVAGRIQKITPPPDACKTIEKASACKKLSLIDFVKDLAVKRLNFRTSVFERSSRTTDRSMSKSTCKTVSDTTNTTSTTGTTGTAGTCSTSQCTTTDKSSDSDKCCRKSCEPVSDTKSDCCTLKTEDVSVCNSPKCNTRNLNFEKKRCCLKGCDAVNVLETKKDCNRGCPIRDETVSICDSPKCNKGNLDFERARCCLKACEPVDVLETKKDCTRGCPPRNFNVEICNSPKCNRSNLDFERARCCLKACIPVDVLETKKDCNRGCPPRNFKVEICDSPKCNRSNLDFERARCCLKACVPVDVIETKKDCNKGCPPRNYEVEICNSPKCNRSTLDFEKKRCCLKACDAVDVLETKKDCNRGCPPRDEGVSACNNSKCNKRTMDFEKKRCCMKACEAVNVIDTKKDCNKGCPPKREAVSACCDDAGTQKDLSPRILQMTSKKIPLSKNSTPSTPSRSISEPTSCSSGSCGMTIPTCTQADSLDGSSPETYDQRYEARNSTMVGGRQLFDNSQVSSKYKAFCDALNTTTTTSDSQSSLDRNAEKNLKNLKKALAWSKLSSNKQRDCNRTGKRKISPEKSQLLKAIEGFQTQMCAEVCGPTTKITTVTKIPSNIRSSKKRTPCGDSRSKSSDSRKTTSSIGQRMMTVNIPVLIEKKDNCTIIVPKTRLKFNTCSSC